MVQPRCGTSTAGLRYRYNRAAVLVQPRFGTGTAALRHRYSRAAVPVQPRCSIGTAVLWYRYSRAAVPVQPRFGTGTAALRYQYSRAAVPVQPRFGNGTAALRYQYSRAAVPVQPRFGTGTAALRYRTWVSRLGSGGVTCPSSLQEAYASPACVGCNALAILPFESCGDRALHRSGHLVHGIYTTCAVLFLFSECSAFDEGFRAKALDVACELALWVSDIPAPGHPVRTVPTAAAAPLCLGCAGRFLVAYRRSTRKAAEWWLLCDTANSLADCTWAVAELCGVAEPHPVFGACSAVLIAMAAMLCLDAAHEATRLRAPKRPKAR